MRNWAAWLAFGALVVPSAARGDEPPRIDHQPLPCTVPDKAVSLCAFVGDDNQVVKARIYFRKAGEKYFSFVEMVFGGMNYCGTVPAPREGKVKAIEYYLQAVDDAYQAQRTSTYQMNIQPEGVCGFPPVEKDPARAASITVYATHKKQGGKLDGGFDRSGVTFVRVK
jgi:hypothetical protein